MSYGRRFSRSEHDALYLAADGSCARCGAVLEPGWHADHMIPHVVGGPTDVINGQALCPRCNLKKGSYVVNLRRWQQDAINSFYEHNARDFLASATPGAGKTTFALELARQLLDAGRVRRVAVVVPTDALRQQWADAAGAVGLALMPIGEAVDYDKAGYDGYVATYAQLSRGAGADLARRATRYATVVFLDEIHHAGESRAWGDGLTYAFDRATTRVALTGTPWREDKRTPIPFVTYNEDGTVHVNAAYEYGEAVADGVCRPIEFHAYDGEARWRDCGEARKADLGSDMDDEDVAAALDAVLRPDHAWMPALLAKAAADLDELRRDVPDAGGLVIAHEQWQAQAYAEILTRITGEAPTVAVSDDPNAKDNIDAFRVGRSRWLVAVKMVSEGVDIPRLAVGVYAAKARTALFFRQVVGRFVRVRPGEQFNARLVIPAIPALMNHAQMIEEELRHQLEIERERDEREQKERGEQLELPLRESIGASEAVFDSAIYKGGAVGADEHARAEEHCRTYSIPLNFAVNIARMLSEQAGTVAAVPSEVKPLARHRHETILRGEIDKLAGKYAYYNGIDKKDVNTRIRIAGFPPRNRCSIEQLEQLRDYLVRALGGS
jgi:superfamily II DNA or RNA helicase